MDTLYLDNYKGFSDTYIPLCDVNFMVGENSTGKTAILKLIELVNTPQFWLDPVFNDDKVELGFFKDIVKQSSTLKDRFYLGEEFRKSRLIQDLEFILLVFCDKKNISTICEYYYTRNHETIVIKIKESSIYYKEYKHKSDIFKKWIEEVRNLDDEFLIKIDDIDYIEEMPLSFVKMLVEKSINDNDDKSASNLFLDIISKKDGYITPIVWSAPIRAKPKRIYEAYNNKISPEGENAPNLLKELIVRGDDNKIKSLLKFGRNSHLFDDFKIDDFNNTGITIGPYSLNVKYGNIVSNIANVGYGVSQVIPLLLEIVTKSYHCFALQQPEVHLHPKAQAAFGEFLYDMMKKDHRKFYIETHSDFLINRYRYCMSQKPLNKKDSQILFFERIKDGTKVTAMPLNNNGQFVKDPPKRYGEFFICEELKMLDL